MGDRPQGDWRGPLAAVRGTELWNIASHVIDAMGTLTDRIRSGACIKREATEMKKEKKRKKDIKDECH